MHVAKYLFICIYMGVVMGVNLYNVHVADIWITSDNGYLNQNYKDF